MLGKAVLQELSAYKQGIQIKDVQKKYNLEKIIKLASNENPYGYSDLVTETLKEMRHDFFLYPDGYAERLRRKLAESYRISLDNLVFGAGSDEIITFICRAFLYEGTNTVMAKATFPQYRHHALIEGATVKEIPTLQNGAHDLDGMLEAIDQNTKVVWLCTPDNPTGQLIRYEQFQQFMEKCPEDVVVVLDEAYYEYVDPNLRYPFEEVLEKYPNVIMLRTFSKIYGLASLRVGYGIANESIAHLLNVVRGPFNTTTLSQRLCEVAFSDQAFVERTRQMNAKVRTQFEQFLDSIGWEYYESHTNFLLVKTPIDADKASNYLLQKGFIVRSGSLLGYPRTLRITIGTEEDMTALQQVILQLQRELE